MLKDLKVAIVQAKVPRNSSEGEAQIRKALVEATIKSVDMVGLPEDCLCGYGEIRAGYQPLEFLKSIAREFKIYLFGATAVLENDGLHNRGFLIDRQGIIIGTHDKIVLTPPEKSDLVAGNSLEVIDTEFGKISILVCKDSFHRYSAWFVDKLRRAGAEIILVPSYSIGLGSHSIELWTHSLKILAKWFNVTILAPGTVGKNMTEYPSFGHSLIIQDYNTLAEGSEKEEEILFASIHKDNCRTVDETYSFPWQPSIVPVTELIK
jgi:predicted amidohydrolase